jgi:lipopolysaccharide biosynthesis glycosyltransferase
VEFIYLKKVSVAFICDSHYVIPTAVAITSLVCNKKPDTYYDIYIIADDLSDNEIDKFYELRESNVDIFIVKASAEKFKGIKKFSYITRAACLKFDLPDLIPDKDKVLYLDSDVIIQKDLRNLFETNIEDYYAGVVKDFVQIDNYLNIKDYSNSGVMLLNLKLMRENGSSAALLSIIKSTKKLKFMDQDCFNIYFINKVKLLPVIYNCFYNLSLQNEEKYTLERINKCFETNYSSLNDIKKDSYIIHMVGYDKPWIYFESVHYHEWNEYFKKSPFKLYNLERRSTKLREFIISHNVTNLSYNFFRLWRDNGFKFAMGKVRKKMFSDRRQ